MILAYHSIFGAYGFWLPNDPRGSWSDYVRRWELYCFGPATKLTAVRSSAHDEHDRKQRLEAKEWLQYPPVVFDGHQALAIGRGFANACQRSGFVILACSILPQHVHLVICRTRYKIERVIGQLKGEATKQLVEARLHPFAGEDPMPTPWARRGWNVYLDTDDAIARAIEYVEQNPVKEGKPLQQWWFVTPFTGV